MKKLTLITAIMLLAVTAFGQRNSREKARPETQNHKSEASTRRSSERTPQTTKAQTSQEHRRATASSNKRTTSMNRSRAVNTNRKPSGMVRTNNGQGKQKPSGTVRTNNGKGKQKPSGKVGTYKGNKGNAENRRHYTTPNRKPVRQAHAVQTRYTPVKYKQVHHHYKVPNRVNVVWTHNMYRDYRRMYPDYHYWYYPTGYRIVTVPYYNSHFHIGEVRNVYGRIHEVWYSWSTDEYYLYFGSAYPYQDFTVILEGREARRFSRHPEAYFRGNYIWATGLLSNFDGKPEMMVRRKSQIHLY